MQDVNNKSFPEQKSEQPFIHKLASPAVFEIPFHANAPSIIGNIAKAFPLQMTIHHISPVFIMPEEYTSPHVHDDSNEIDIIVSTQRLICQVQLAGKQYIVHNNAAIWIPRGNLHSVNVLKGTGFFIALRLNP